MTTVHLLHGIHTSKNSRRLADLAPIVEQASGLPVVYHEYGDILAIQTRWKNPGIAERLAKLVEPGDVLVGHSNGCAIWTRVLMLGAPAQGVVLLNGALDDSIEFPPQLKWAHVYFNQYDKAVPWAERMPKWLLDPMWGDLGRDGYRGKDPRVTKTDCFNSPPFPPLAGHSAIIDGRPARVWAQVWGGRIGEAAL